MNTIAATFVAIGVLFDGGVWYLVKDLKIFDDEEPNDTPLAELEKDDVNGDEVALTKVKNIVK